MRAAVAAGLFPRAPRTLLAGGDSTAIETALNVPWGLIESILPVTDPTMIDIKITDSAEHREYTGVPNDRVLANAERLGQQSQPLIVRTPIIPHVNDTAEHVQAIAQFVSRLPNLIYYELLPFHPLAKSKYESLGLEYAAGDLQSPAKEQSACHEPRREGSDGLATPGARSGAH